MAVFFTFALTAGSLKEQSTMSRLSIKHREQKGIGYEKGYSSGDLFLAPIWRHDFLPFANLRFHVMNDGRFAFNGGLGLRCPMTDSCIFGLNGFYDYRSADDLSPSQIGVGFEALTDLFDIRLNGYVPFSDDTFFKRYPAYIHGQTASYKEEASAALPVVNGELGVPFFERCNAFFLYAAAGPYYLFQRRTHGFSLGGSWGGEARLSATLSKILQVECAVTYDKIFQTTVQGMLALRMPLGPRNLGRQGANDVLCSLITQPIVRHEIIPIQDPERNMPLLNPLTGKPAHFVIVNKVQDLKRAEVESKEGDILYVDYNDGDLYSGTLTLKPKQILHSSALPFISGGSGFLASSPNQFPHIESVIFADNTQAAGFNIKNVTFKGKNVVLAFSEIENVVVTDAQADVSFTAQNSVFNSGLDLKIHDEATMTAQMIHCRAKGSACFECFDQASCDVR
ncbi:MAG: inverse autotransporter beta domain-containing protein, partial [Chlamydiia bacterium]|nr:inverse autotransporter beta domain-containing protein [Chlamydiia bacterium]